jgi:FtsP/CotA-like multicopper oxidase with cupredoxin domain
MTAHAKPRFCKRHQASDGAKGWWNHWLTAISTVGAVMWLQMLPADAQPLPPEDCLALDQPEKSLPLIRMPELVSKGGKLRQTILLQDELRRLNDTRDASAVKCDHVFLRFFQGDAAVPPPVPLDGSPAPPPAGKYKDPAPGPTLRARVGDIVQLTFLNQVDVLNHANTLDRGKDSRACDKFPVGAGGVAPDKGYPENAGDTPPNCFHGSSTANIHFHGTHTNPNTTGDNVFLHVRPSPRSGGKPKVTAKSIEASFARFFADCERHLNNDILSEWPYTWDDLPVAWTREQRDLLRKHDNGKPADQRLWPENQKQINAKGWPQYYVGAFPFCFRLPKYTAAVWPPPSDHPLKMGQAPGTHWYHAHKHGSTALNVSNGMTGAFIIEGEYDDDLNAFYGKIGDNPWMRAQPVLVINQLGQSSNLARNAPINPQAFSVNGRLQPTLTMRAGEVQLWRIVNTASRSFAHFVPPTDGFEWMQIAEDGVQFEFKNYKGSLNKPVLLAPGNRADLLVKAPTNLSKYKIMVQDTVTRSGLTSTSPQPLVLMYVEVSGSTPEKQEQTQFIGMEPPVAETEVPKTFPRFPVFLADIADKEVKYQRTLRFNSKGQGVKQQHTIDGEQFSEKIGARVLLNTVEEWKMENYTTIETGPNRTNIDHPFHIHVNPFQVVELFDPNDTVRVGEKDLPKYVFHDDPTNRDPAQCYLDPLKPKMWKDCQDIKTRNIWWDVFPIPSGKIARGADERPIMDSNGEPIVVPGYFKMRSRFVDFPGFYVLHCHILAHEDRGMMTIVEVQKISPTTQLPLRHH